VTDVDLSHARASQDEVATALAVPAFFPHRPATVEHVQTHISHVFLAGPYVYKLKKAVRFVPRFPHARAAALVLRRGLRLVVASPHRSIDVVAVVRRGQDPGARGRRRAGQPVVRMHTSAGRMLPALARARSMRP
jgi:aminoglycoside phosphotransferase family enzyme